MGMKIVNKTEVPTLFLRRMVNWVWHYKPPKETAKEPEGIAVVVGNTATWYIVGEGFKAVRSQQPPQIVFKRATATDYTIKPWGWSRKRGDDNVGGVTMLVGPVNPDKDDTGVYAKSRVFHMVLCLYASFNTKNSNVASLPKPEEFTGLALFRLPIGKHFMDRADKLIKEWSVGAIPPDLEVKYEKEKKTAEALVKWQRRLKLAKTKVRIWHRRNRAASAAVKRAVLDRNAKQEKPCQ